MKYSGGGENKGCIKCMYKILPSLSFDLLNRSCHSFVLE